MLLDGLVGVVVGWLFVFVVCPLLWFQALATESWRGVPLQVLLAGDVVCYGLSSRDVQLRSCLV